MLFKSKVEKLSMWVQKYRKTSDINIIFGLLVCVFFIFFIIKTHWWFSNYMGWDHMYTEYYVNKFSDQKSTNIMVQCATPKMGNNHMKKVHILLSIFF